jgi:hypothetical protein
MDKFLPLQLITTGLEKDIDKDIAIQTIKIIKNFLLGDDKSQKLFCKEYIQLDKDQLIFILKNVFMTLYNRYIDKKYKNTPYFITYFYNKKKNEFINFLVYKKNYIKKEIFIELICNQNKNNKNNNKLLYFLIKNLSYYYNGYTFNIIPNEKSINLFLGFGFSKNEDNLEYKTLSATSDTIKSNLNKAIYEKKTSKNNNIYFVEMT